MGLTQAQKAMIEKARSAGVGGQAVPLDDRTCAYLVAVAVRDLGLQGHFPELPQDLPQFFESQNLNDLGVTSVAFLPLMERLVGLNPNADLFFVCLASLHKRRLKYERILQTQAMPTIEQVGPRGLLQYGTMTPCALAGLLFWRKWLFDLDNRAGQETGYLFEPIIAHAIGGAPFSAKASPVRRSRNPQKGRQVDCIRDQKAYEFKIRVTIASSGQGRWQEELEFPADARSSNYTPVLVVLDATPNPKLAQLEAAFVDAHGEVYKGAAAWAHLDAVAGPTMAVFLEKYVRGPMQSLLVAAPHELPDFQAKMHGQSITLYIGGESLHIKRQPTQEVDDQSDDLPDDANDGIPGP